MELVGKHTFEGHRKVAVMVGGGVMTTFVGKAGDFQITGRGGCRSLTMISVEAADPGIARRGSGGPSSRLVAPRR